MNPIALPRSAPVSVTPVELPPFASGLDPSSPGMGALNLPTDARRLGHVRGEILDLVLSPSCPPGAPWRPS